MICVHDTKVRKVGAMDFGLKHANMRAHAVANYRVNQLI